MTETLFHYIVHVWIFIAIIIFPVVLRITAPYGRHSKQTWGPMISNRAGWIIMESPALFLFAAFFLTGTGEKPMITWILFSFWLLHYINRTLIFPFRIRTSGKKMPVLIVLMAFCFNLVNAFINGYFLGNLASPEKYPDSMIFHPVFIGGILLFLTGMAINLWSDQILIHLRKSGDNGYSIPRKGLFRYISCPNHFGEIIEWTGFFVMAMSFPTLSFLIWTIINLLPRALQHHRWYKETFTDYPTERKALIPYLL